MQYLYDDTGKLLEENIVNENNRVGKRIVYKYDDKGSPETLVGYNANNVFAGKESYRYTYDAKGNWISKVVLINNMPIGIIERAIEYY